MFYRTLLWMLTAAVCVLTLHSEDAAALRASAHKLHLGSVHFHGHDTDEQRVRVLGPGDQVVRSAAQQAAAQRPEAGANGGQLHRDGELLAAVCDAARQAFLDFSTGLWTQRANRV